MKERTNFFLKRVNADARIKTEEIKAISRNGSVSWSMKAFGINGLTSWYWV